MKGNAKRPRRGRSPGGRSPYLFIRRSPYFSPGGKVPKVPFLASLRMIALYQNRRFSRTTKDLLHSMDASIGKASLSRLASRPPKKVGRRQAGRRYSQSSNHFRRAIAPRPLLADFHGGQPANINRFCFINPVLCQPQTLSVGSPNGISRRSDRAFCFFFAGEKEKGKRKGRAVAVYPAGDPHTFS